MRTLLWKELRENIKWALLVMVLLGGAEVYALYPRDMQEENYGAMFSGSTLLRPAFLAVTTFGCAGAGFALGLIQILPELRRDRWAALLHRPVTRGTLFLGKALAGMILYGVATVPPFLLAVYLTATPGHFGTPFVPEMALAGTIDTVMGLVYYFAALATGLQRGGALVLRVFPLLAAIHTSFFVNYANLFYVALEATILMGLLLFTAGWGIMLNQDSVNRRPWLGKVAFLAMAFYGVCGVGDLIRSFANSMVPQPYGNFQRYEITNEGFPVRIIYGKGGVVVAVMDLEGKPMTDSKYQPDKIRNHIKGLNGFTEFIGESHGYKPRNYTSGYREQRAYFWGDNPIYSPRLQHWYYMVKERYMIGYDSSKKAIAILDQQGFKPATEKPVPFAPGVEQGYAGQGSRVLWGPDSARYAFFSEQKVVTVSMPAPMPIYGEGHAFASKGQISVATGGFALATGMAVFDDKAAFVAFLPYKHDVSQWGQIQLGLNGSLDRFYLWYQPSGFIDKNKLYHLPGSPDPKQLERMPSYIDETDAQGNVLHSYVLPALPPDPPRPQTWVMIVSAQLQTPGFFYGEIIYKKIGALLGSTRLKGDLARQFAAGQRDNTWGWLVWLPLVNAILGLLALVWARRVYFLWSSAGAWAVFVTALGLPGLIIFRLASDWPSLVSCATCSNLRPIESSTCPACRTGWPLPVQKGTEIFDEARNGAEPVAAI